MTIITALINNFEYLLSKIKSDNQEWEYRLSSINKRKIGREIKNLCIDFKLNDISKNKKKYLIIQVCYHMYMKLILLGNKLFNIKLLSDDYKKKEISETLDMLILQSYNNREIFLEKLMKATKKNIKFDTKDINEITLLVVTFNHLLSAIMESIDLKNIVKELLSEYDNIKREKKIKKSEEEYHDII